MKTEFSFKRFIWALLIGAGGALAANFNQPFLIPAVAAIGFMGACWGMSYALVAIVFTAGGAVLEFAPELIPTVSVTAALVLSSAVLVIGLKKKLPYRLMAAIIAVIVLAALYISLSLPSILAGSEPFAWVDKLISDYAAIGEQLGYAPESISELRDMLGVIYYGVLIIVAEGAGFLAVLLAKLFAEKAKADIRPMAKFIEWHLPRSLKIGLPLLAAGIIIMYLARFGGAPTMLATVGYMLMPLFFAAGLATLLYVATRRPGSAFFIVMVILISVLMPFFTTLVGVVDLYAGIRRRFIKTDKLIREAFEKAERTKSNTVTVDFGDGRGPQVIAVRKKRNDDAFFDGKSEAAEKDGGKAETGALPGENGEQNGEEQKAPDNSEENDGGENQ